MTGVIKEYLKWLVPMALFSFIVILLLPSKVIGVLGLVATFFVPVDRVRNSMLKRRAPIPPKRVALKYIGIFCIAPTLLALYAGFEQEVPEGMFRANVVVTNLMFFTGVPLIFYCIQFLSGSTWERALKKYGSE